jgi:cathepsin A (carboxypeptidase C)
VKPAHRPKTIDDVTLDLKYFLDTFVTEAFPEVRGRDFHVTGESYGGLQAISLAHALANPDTEGPRPDVSLRSLVASSTFADLAYSAPGYYDVLCGREHTYLNRTECATMAAAVPECEVAALACRQTMGGEQCWAMASACAPILQFWYPPEKNIVHRMCSRSAIVRLFCPRSWCKDASHWLPLN